MKRCNLCNYNNNDEAYFCENCGNDIKTANFSQNEDPQNAPRIVYANSYNIPEPISAEDNKKANILCIISLICYFGGSGLFVLIGSLFGRSNAEVIQNLFTSLGGLSNIAGLVLMIVARVKYPQNKFAKIIMWIYISMYIAGVVLLIIGIIVFFLFLGLLIYSCRGISG